VESLSLSFIYKIAQDIWGIFSGRSEKRAKQDLDSREKWKDKIQNYLNEIISKNLRDDIIIRDVNRYDEYPETKPHEGISPWFKLGLLELYHNGIKVGLRISSLIYEESESSWRKSSEDEGEEQCINAYLVGYIPFRNIVSVDFEGDEYYSFPHFTCRFSDKKMPYEKLIYCEKREFMDGRFYFSELESDSKVKLTSAKFGTENQW